MARWAPLEERLACNLVRQPNGCLEWQASRNADGYGRIGTRGKNAHTHRVAWEIANGPIPPGVDVLHHCDNPPCGQTEPTEGYPDGHLFLGTTADNMADMVTKGRWGGGMGQHNAAKTHCPSNHPYDAVNTYVTRDGHRECRICRAAYFEAYKQRSTLGSN